MIKKSLLLLAVLLLAVCSVEAAGEKSLREVLDAQRNSSLIDIPQGTYILDLKEPNQEPYVFRDKKNVVINGNGSRIICNRQSQAFVFNDCEHVTFKNLTIEYDPPCESQGTIVELSSDKKTWTVEIHPNYPTETTDELGEGAGISHGRILAYDKDTHLLKKGMWTLGTSSFTRVSENKLRFKATDQNPADNPIQLGDFVAFEVFPVGWNAAHTIFLARCKNMLLENITVYDSNCFSFLEEDCESNRYYRCVVTRKLGDEKYGDRLRAGIADMFHSKHAKGGPYLEECTFEYAGDDGIAINGNFYPIYKADPEEKAVYLLSRSAGTGSFKIRQNETFVCVNNNGTIRGEAKVMSVATATVTQAERDVTFSKLSQVLNNHEFANGLKIVLEEWIEDIDAGDVGYSNDRIGSGYRIKNCTVGGNRSRGILIKASDGIIEGTTVQNCAMSGIAFAPEFYWMEAGCPSNTIVRNNTIRTCMFDADMGHSQFAALVAVSEAPNGKISPAGGLRNIAIYNNVIEDCPWPAVGLAGVDKVYFKDNTIGEQPYERRHGSSFGVKYNQPLCRINVTNFSTTNNWVEQTSVKHIQGDDLKMFIQDGILMLPAKWEDKAVNVELYNLSGEKVLSGSPDGVSLPVNHLPKGVYLMQLYCEGESATVKIMNY